MNPLRRLRLTLASTVAATVVGVGAVGRALTWSPSPAAGLTVAVGGLVALVAGALALRILVVLDRGR